MVCKTQGSMVSMLYKLGWLVLKLSMEETLSPSKKNWVVISLPSLLIQVRKQPFSIKNIFFEISPSRSRVVLAGTSIRLKYGESFSHRTESTFLCICMARFFRFLSYRLPRQIFGKFIRLGGMSGYFTGILARSSRRECSPFGFAIS